MFCSNCGKPNDDNVRFCTNCGSELTASTFGSNVNAEFSAEPVVTQSNTTSESNPGLGLAIASMVCGFASFSCMIIPGIVGLILGIIAKKKGCKSPMATTGIICSSIGIGLGIIFWVIYGIALGVAFSEVSSYGSYYDPYYYYY